MRKLKNEKGITLIALAITVAVLSIISIPVLVNMADIVEFNKYTGFKKDIDVLREAVSVAYYNEDISSIGPTYIGSKEFLKGTQNGKTIKNENDNDVYYVISIDKVNEKIHSKMEELNNGSGNKKVGIMSTYKGTNDVYIINEQSRTIYYVRGITYKEKTYYRLNEDFSSAEVGITPGTLVEGFNKIYTDKYGNKAKIPVGYKVSSNAEEQIISKGLVISDNSGNEFVWVPVQDFQTEDGKNVSVNFDRYTYGTQISKGQDKDSESIMIKLSDSDNYFFYEIKNSFEALSAIENKGFYIGRYETKSTTARTSSSAVNNADMKVNNGANVYNYVTRDEAVTLSEKLINNNYVKSRLCSSYAWDTTLKFIEATGNSGYITSVGSTGTDKINNIFNLANNVYEWTTEKSTETSNACTTRGGRANTDNPSTRKKHNNTKDANVGFRITLFLSIN